MANFEKAVKAYVSGDYKTALEEWTPLAEQGYASAQSMLGVMYDYGQGVLKNNKTAVKWFTLAAEQGHAKAQSYLGNMYENGERGLKNCETSEERHTLADELEPYRQ